MGTQRSPQEHDFRGLRYGLTTDGGIFDLFTDQADAGFALLDVAANEPDLAVGLGVVEQEARVRRVVRRSA